MGEDVPAALPASLAVANAAVNAACSSSVDSVLMHVCGHELLQLDAEQREKHKRKVATKTAAVER